MGIYPLFKNYTYICTMENKNIKIGIYMILNTSNNKKYIGSSKNIYQRWNIHKKELNKNKHHNQYLQFSWNKYGKENFEFSIIEITTMENLIAQERYWCSILDTHNSNKGYNIATIEKGAEVCKEYIKLKRNLCQNKQRVWLTDLKGNILNVFESHKEASRILETTETHIHFLTKGKVNIFKRQFLLWSSLYFTQKDINNKTKPRKGTNMIIIYQFDLKGNFIKQFNSIKEATIEAGVSSIKDCLKGKQRQAGGFLWSFSKTPPSYTPPKKLKQYSLDNQFINSFKTILEAATATNSKPKGIQKVLGGTRNYHNNFIWKWK